MNVIESLQTGRFGIELRMPEHFEVCRNDGECAEFVDKTKGVVWYLFLYPNLHLDLHAKHRADLRNSLEYYARSMFDEVFHHRHRGDAKQTPRTADLAWSPMIDVEPSKFGEVDALRTVHRMAYEPGREMIMGHALIPVRQGLFEARVLCVDQMTGIRESILFSKRMMQQKSDNEADIEQLMATARQSDYDDPQHDDGFPEHSLSRARAALRWLQNESKIQVTEPPRPFADGEIELPHLGCAVVLPPRFALEDAAAGTFCRVSFCGSDGIERLRIERSADATSPASTNLATTAKSIARELHVASGVKKIRLTVETLVGPNGNPQVLVIVEGKGHTGQLRNAMIFFRDDRQRLWSLSRLGTAAVPNEALKADLTQTATSFRLLTSPEKQKPWWNFW